MFFYFFPEARGRRSMSCPSRFRSRRGPCGERPPGGAERGRNCTLPNGQSLSNDGEGKKGILKDSLDLQSKSLSDTVSQVSFTRQSVRLWSVAIALCSLMCGHLHIHTRNGLLREPAAASSGLNLKRPRLYCVFKKEKLNSFLLLVDNAV